MGADCARVIFCVENGAAAFTRRYLVIASMAAVSRGSGGGGWLAARESEPEIYQRVAIAALSQKYGGLPVGLR